MYIEEGGVSLRGGALASTLKTLGCVEDGDAEAPEDSMSHFLELQAGFKGQTRHKGVGATSPGRVVLTGQWGRNPTVLWSSQSPGPKSVGVGG